MGSEWYCKKCGRKWFKKYHPIPTPPKIGVICPRCGSDNIGYNDIHKIDYRCRDCRKSWRTHYQQLKTVDKTCPRCNSKDVTVYGKIHKKYHCRECRNNWLGEFKKTRKLICHEGIKCIECKSENLISSGTNWQCKDCGRRFNKIQRRIEIYHDDIKCPECNSDKIKSSGPCWACNNCGKSFRKGSRKLDVPDYTIYLNKSKTIILK